MVGTNVESPVLVRSWNYDVRQHNKCHVITDRLDSRTESKLRLSGRQIRSTCKLSTRDTSDTTYQVCSCCYTVVSTYSRPPKDASFLFCQEYRPSDHSSICNRSAHPCSTLQSSPCSLILCRRFPQGLCGKLNPLWYQESRLKRPRYPRLDFFSSCSRCGLYDS